MARIAELLRDKFGSLNAILEAQARVLDQQLQRVLRARGLIGMVRAKLVAGQKLSADDLAKLTTGTMVIATPSNDNELKTLM